jgi:hypothetical protein
VQAIDILKLCLDLAFFFVVDDRGHVGPFFMLIDEIFKEFIGAHVAGKLGLKSGGILYERLDLVACFFDLKRKFRTWVYFLLRRQFNVLRLGFAEKGSIDLKRS